MKSPAKTLALALVLLGVEPGCKGDTDAQVCEPDTVRECVGPSACVGVQQCATYGTRWLECRCDAGAGGDSGLGGAGGDRNAGDSSAGTSTLGGTAGTGGRSTEGGGAAGSAGTAGATGSQRGEACSEGSTLGPGDFCWQLESNPDASSSWLESPTEENLRATLHSPPNVPAGLRFWWPGAESVDLGAYDTFRFTANIPESDSFEVMLQNTASEQSCVWWLVGTGELDTYELDLELPNACWEGTRLTCGWNLMADSAVIMPALVFDEDLDIELTAAEFLTTATGAGSTYGTGPGGYCWGQYSDPLGTIAWVSVPDDTEARAHLTSVAESSSGVKAYLPEGFDAGAYDAVEVVAEVPGSQIGQFFVGDANEAYCQWVFTGTDALETYRFDLASPNYCDDDWDPSSAALVLLGSDWTSASELDIRITDISFESGATGAGGAGGVLDGAPTAGTPPGGLPAGGAPAGGASAGGGGAGGAACVDPPSAASSCTTTVGSGSLGLIDDVSDNDNFIISHDGRSGAWWPTNDGTGTQVPARWEDIAFTDGQACTTGSGFTDWGAGIGMMINGPDPNCPHDASAYSGVSFLISGEIPSGTFRFEVGTADTIPIGENDAGECPCTATCGDFHGYTLELTNTPQRVTIPFASLSQDGWGTPVDWNPEAIINMQWVVQVERGDGTDAPAEFAFCLDEVEFY